MNRSIRLSGIVDESIVDGPGSRMAVFVQGCPHHCPGCHNPQTHDFSGGYDEAPENIFRRYTANPLLKGVTFSGGEPFAQAKALIPLACMLREAGASLWIYSGYTLEQLLSPEAPAGSRELLALCDVLVDGPFLLEHRNLELPYRGSDNQRVLDLPLSLQEGRAVSCLLDSEQ